MPSPAHEAVIASYTKAQTRHAAAGVETAKDAAAARARGDHIMANALEAIHANFAPVHPVAKEVALARRSHREAWKLRAGLIEARDGAADHWCERLKADAVRHMQMARDLRFELVVMPVEPLPHTALTASEAGGVKMVEVA